MLKRESADLVYHLGHTASPPTHLEDSSQVTVSALLVSASRHDAALEQIIGRMSLEPFVTAVHWQVEQAAAEN